MLKVFFPWGLQGLLLLVVELKRQIAEQLQGAQKDADLGQLQSVVSRRLVRERPSFFQPHIEEEGRGGR